ncbi:MAG TPA: ATP-dependent DNA helicase, partial [Acidimicrobiales bacterium]|nr:ATP-dependent DNA helicase [Acidimicrobiales bacterium]
MSSADRHISPTDRPAPVPDVDPGIERALVRSTRNLPKHEDRPQQRAMAQAVGAAIKQRRHLIVQAGTGTGKSLAYLVPALALGQRVVVSTATKALQDQLAHRDLPQLSRSLGVGFRYAVLKGRSNYVCRQRVEEFSGGADQLLLGEDDGVGTVGEWTSSRFGREVRRLVSWAREGGARGKAGEGGARGKNGAFSGDRAELPWEPSDTAWSQVSTSWRECPGASECPSGGDCFAEAARQRANRADVVVVNTHLYAASLAMSESELLPAHDLVVFDEAHEVEDIASAAFGFELSHTRLVALARLARPLLADSSAAAGVEDGAALLAGALRAHCDQPLGRPLDEDIARVVGLLRERANVLLEALRKGRSGGPEGAAGGGGGSGARTVRAQRAASLLVDELNEILELPEGQVAWVEGPEQAPTLCVAPIDVGGILCERLWAGEDAPTAVLTSATIPPHLGDRLGLAGGSYDEQDVGSPFCYSEQALLYCPLHLPDPRAPGFEAATHEELIALIEAAQGRTLALFTSWRAMQAAAEVARRRLPWTILTQSDWPKVKLVNLFSSDEHSCLFATMGFWQGVDVPGPSLSLVTIDRLPFPRPDDPLLRARRDALGAKAF